MNSPPLSAGSLRATGGGLLREDPVLVRVRGRTAAQQDQRLLAGVDELVLGPGRDHGAVAGDDVALLVAEAQPSAAGGEEIELLADAVVVRDRRPAGGDRRLRERLPAGGERDASGDLADG